MGEAGEQRADFDVLTTTAAELQDLLEAGKTTSGKLAQIYLDEIEKHNGYLKAVICTVPKALLLKKAKELDEERANGTIRSRLHGVPILVKDNIATHPDMGMDTTAGSFALAGSRPKKSADIVERLINGGALIIGKANLSELSYWKGVKLLCGWSAVGGQGQSPYVRGGIDPDDSYGGHSNPGGSSAGSAIAVAAGLAPLSIGTETEGSLIMPGGRAALYTIKPTIGLVSGQGIVPVSEICDSAGPMTKSVLDLANLMDVIVDPSKTEVPKGGYASVMTDNWNDLRVGVLEISEWKFPDDIIPPNKPQVDKEMNDAYESAYAKIKSLAKSFHQDVPLPNAPDFKPEGEEEDDCIDILMNGHFTKDFANYTSGITDSKVYTVEQLVEYNKEHADVELPPEYPNQDKLIEAISSKPTAEYLDKALAHAREYGRVKGMDKILKDYDIDVIIGPAESAMSLVASASGYPIATLPLGYASYNGRPYALAALAAGHGEATLIKLQSAWEATFPKRQPPAKENFHGK